MIESICPQCKKVLTALDEKEVLNVFNIANPDYKNREYYCGFDCIQKKVEDVKNNVPVYPFESIKINVLGFYKSLSGEYAVIVDV